MNLSSSTSAVLLLTLAACESSSPGVVPVVVDVGTFPDGGKLTTPTVVLSVPEPDATEVPINTGVSAMFSEPMDAATLTTSSFTLTSGATPVPGTVVYANSMATFWPSAHLVPNGTFTATVQVTAKSAYGIALASKFSWNFSTGTAMAHGERVNLRSVEGFAILAKSAVSTVPASSVTGDVGVSPAAASFITGFGLSADATNAFATSPQVIGKVYAANYAVPTPATMTAAVSDMEIAFTDAAARAPDVTELGAGNIGGMTLTPGVYKFGTGLLIPTDLTLNGNESGVWIFQIAQNLTVASATKVVLTGGALPKNVFWQVSGSATLGTTSHLEGIVLSKTAITLRTGASVNGRLLAQTAVDIDGSTVVAPVK